MCKRKRTTSHEEENKTRNLEFAALRMRIQILEAQHKRDLDAITILHCQKLAIDRTNKQQKEEYSQKETLLNSEISFLRQNNCDLNYKNECMKENIYLQQECLRKNSDTILQYEQSILSLVSERRALLDKTKDLQETNTKLSAQIEAMILCKRYGLDITEETHLQLVDAVLKGIKPESSLKKLTVSVGHESSPEIPNESMPFRSFDPGTVKRITNESVSSLVPTTSTAPGETGSIYIPSDTDFNPDSILNIDSLDALSETELFGDFDLSTLPESDGS